MTSSTPDKEPPKKDPSEKEQTSQKNSLDLARRNPLPGNRPIVKTNKDDDIDDFVGYMD